MRTTLGQYISRADSGACEGRRRRQRRERDPSQRPTWRPAARMATPHRCRTQERDKHAHRFAPTTGTRRAHPNMHGLGRYCNCWRHYTTAGRNIRRQNDSRARLPTRLSDRTLIAVPIRCSRNTAHPTASVGRLSPRFVLLLLRHNGSRADRHTHRTSPHQHEPTQPNSPTRLPGRDTPTYVRTGRSDLESGRPQAQLVAPPS
jgi:hypothetical protein